MFSLEFLIRMARCSQEPLCHACPLPEDVSFCLSWARSTDLSQTQSRAVGRALQLSRRLGGVDKVCKVCVQLEAGTLPVAPCRSICLCSSPALEMSILAMSFASSNHRNPTAQVLQTGAITCLNVLGFGVFFNNLNVKVF